MRNFTIFPDVAIGNEMKFDLADQIINHYKEKQSKEFDIVYDAEKNEFRSGRKDDFESRKLAGLITAIKYYSGYNEDYVSTHLIQIIDIICKSEFEGIVSALQHEKAKAKSHPVNVENLNSLIDRFKHLYSGYPRLVFLSERNKDLLTAGLIHKCNELEEYRIKK